jgi:thiol-disulfide isomerase/thioredoxin
MEKPETSKSGKAPEKKKAALAAPTATGAAKTAKAERRPVASAQAAAAPPEKQGAELRMVRNIAVQLGFVGLAAFAVFSFVHAGRKDQMRADCGSTCVMKPAYAGRNKLAPDFTLPTLDGGQVRLSDYKGKTVVLNFWASWCAPCRDEMPSIARLALALEGRKDVALLTVSVDEDPQSIKDTLATLWAADDELKKKLQNGKIPFPVLLDPELSVVKNLYGTTMYPETWIIDREGFIRSRFDGDKDWAGAAAINLIETTNRAGGCLAEFQAAKPIGSFAKLCDSD